MLRGSLILFSEMNVELDEEAMNKVASRCCFEIIAITIR
jgi:hypothetical protein